MYEGNPVDLRMEKILSADGIFDDSTRQCRVRKYDPEEDFIYLELKEDKLETISLDAKYRCYISTRTELLYCTGVVKERYCQEDKKLLPEMVRFFFYKNLVNCVDKLKAECYFIFMRFSTRKK